MGHRPLPRAKDFGLEMAQGGKERDDSVSRGAGANMPPAQGQARLGPLQGLARALLVRPPGCGEWIPGRAHSALAAQAAEIYVQIMTLLRMNPAAARTQPAGRRPALPAAHAS